MARSCRVAVKKTLLVRSRKGGLVSQDCLSCGNSAYIRLENLPEMNCESCGSPLVARYGELSNYYYCCDGCGRSWKLADNLPPWSDLFAYSGLAAYGDEITTRER